MRGVLCAAVALALCCPAAVLASAEPQQSGEDVDGGAQSAGGLETYQDWIDAYPLQYASFNQPFESNGKNHSHSAIVLNEFSSIYPGCQAGFCISCKSTQYDDWYVAYGEDAANETNKFLALERDEMWECTACHTETDDGVTTEANLVGWNTRSGEHVGELAMGTEVCAQCHNSMATLPQTGDEVYRYGTDNASVYRANVELAEKMGRNPDPATGAIVFVAGVADFETYVGSTHDLLGVTCVDCHMTEAVDEAGGATYTSHYASSSPLDNEAALEYCLTCHGEQGIGSTDEMRSMVETRQDELRTLFSAAQEAYVGLGARLTELTAAGVTGEAVEQAREAYSYASFTLNGVNGSGILDPGCRVAHDPDGLVTSVAEVEEMCTESLEALSGLGA